MLNIDPQLFQPKIIRMQTTHSIGLPGHHIVRTTHYSNSQVMTGATTQVRIEANNNIVAANEPDPTGDYGMEPYKRRSFHEMEQDTEGTGPQVEWTPDQMAWSGENSSASLDRLCQHGSVSMMSFQSTLSDTSLHSQLSEEHSEQSKEEEIISQLNEARACSREEASKLLLKMTYSNGNCALMRQCGCLPLLIDLLHSHDDNSNSYRQTNREYLEVRRNANQVLHNIIFSQQRPDDKRARREGRVLRHLEEIRDYADQLLCAEGNVDNRTASFIDQNLTPSVAALMKLSFDEDHRHAMCQLGGLQAIAELLRVDHWAHGVNNDPHCTTLRRYLGMSLTNLTFGDGANKALLCSMRPFMEALVAQLYSPSEDLRQVTASVLRNLSWRADPASKRALRDVGAVPLLVRAALSAQKDSTLKSVLSALWNLSAHCSANKADICRVEGALAFLVSTLTHKTKVKTLAIVENGGGILRNVSSHVAIQNEYRAVLRRHNCLQVLLTHLKSPSLTVVSNACGTLWNLSARNATDQRALWEMGAVGMLRKLVNSKHKMISMGSSAALKNLLSARPPGVGLCLMEDGVGYRGADAPSLVVRKQKALSTEIDQNLSETYDNTDSPKTSPVKQADQAQTRSRRHISPSAARYMANQKLKTELSLPRSDEPRMTGSYVVEEKHNGAFQVTKNAKQALNYRQGRLQLDPRGGPDAEPGPKPGLRPTKDVPKPEQPPAATESGSKLCFRPAKFEKDAVPNQPEPASSRLGPRLTRLDKEVPRPSTEAARNASRSMSPMGVKKDKSSAAPKAIEQAKVTPEVAPPASKPPHESRIPLPKSSVSRLDCQRSQSASPVAQRRNQRQEDVARGAKQDHPNHVDIPAQRPVDITVTHPKWAWTASPEKVDNAPERPGKRLDEDSGGEDEVRVWRTEDTPSRMSSANDLEEEEPEEVGARCSLNIRTSTGVRMIRNHPLLANAAAHRAEEEGRVFDHRNREENFQDFESGKTVEFCVQSEYDIEDTLSLMSRSSSVASISSFDQQSFHEDESFASDLSHRTSGIESPSELSDSPCQTAPTSPLGSSNYISLCGDVSDDVQIRSSAADRTDPQEVTCELEAEGPPINLNLQKETPHHDDEVHDETTLHPIEDSAPVDVRVFQDDPPPKPDEGQAPSPAHLTNPAYSEADLRTNRVSRSSSSSSFSVEDISPSERVILEECIRAGMPIAPPTYQMLANASARRPLPPKDGEYESEEKGKEDERKAEKSRLFRIPESPGSCPRKDDRGGSRKTVLDQMGNRRFEKHQQGKFNAPDVPNQLSFLMSAQRTAKDGGDCFPHPKTDGRLTEESKEAGRDVEVVPSRLGFLLRGTPKDGGEPIKSTERGIRKPESTTCASSTVRNEPDAATESASPPAHRKEPVGDARQTTKGSVSSVGKSSSEDDEEKDIDCSESEEVMLTSSLLGEAREIAEALLMGGSTEDMTVSTLSCLSDIDNARPPSAMADLGCLSADDSVRATHLLGRQTTSKKSLLRELQMGRLASSSNDSPENLSLRSSCTSDLLGNVNPPSALDDMSLTGSMGSLDSDDSECEPQPHGKNLPSRNQDGSLSERMHDAAALAQLYARELSAITGGPQADDRPADDPARIRIPSAVQEVTIADVTDIGCDTVGSDTEVEEDLPCDDEDTLRAASLTKDEGSSENLTLTLSEEPRPDLSPFLLKPFMTSEEFRALQENADLILNTLRDVEVSDDDEEGAHSNSGDLLEDETMSLVSNESDEECPSPHQRVSPRVDQVLSPTCNGMVGLPQSHGSPRPRKTSLPQVQSRRFSGLKDPNRYSINGDPAPASRVEQGEELGLGFDSRTFTRKRSSVPKEMVPTVQARAPLRSPSGATGPSFPRPVASKIAGAWKGRSKSADVNRNSKLKMAPPASPLHKEEDKYSQRSTPSPKSPLSRSNTFEKLADEESSPHSSIRRPNSLALSQKSNSPRHAFPLRSNAPSQKPANDGLVRPRTVLPPRTSEDAILSPSGNIPRVMNKIPVSNIPSRRSMIPTPAKIGMPEN